MEETILLETKGPIATVLFNRPKSYNSFDLDTIIAFAGRIVSLAADRGVQGVIISGTGKAFCSGGDLRWVSGFEKGAPAAFHELSSRFHQAVTEVRRMRKPVVAAINGIAAGGGFSLALACDFRVMAETAQLKQGFTSNGLSMDGSGTFALPRLVGQAKAMEIMAFDLPIQAEEALRLGLVTRVVRDGDILYESEGMISEMLRTAPLSSFGWSKELLNDSLYTSFEAQMERERKALSSCASHPGGIEGMRAFIEKRKPRFD